MTDAEINTVKRRYGIFGNSTSLNHAIQVASQVAPTDMTVLINGESGSGKESFSKIIHHLSPRKHKEFIAINCGAIPEGTIDSELFGHEKGAFTGAQDARKGYFEVTNGGTIFLDEIAEMPLGTQSRLLRVLENGEYIRVGSSKVLKTDVRVIAASHIDLASAVEKGRFREDLFYRLSTVPIKVPPLRERGTDIYLLFRKFAADFSEKYHAKPVKLSGDAQFTLNEFAFPGNIRQLKNIVDQLSVLEIEREINKETLLKYLPISISKNRLPMLIDSNEKQGVNERDLLYQVLFDMKKDMSELKKLVFESLRNEPAGTEVLENHKDLFTNIDREESKYSSNDSQYLLEAPRQESSPSETTSESYQIGTNDEEFVATKTQDVHHIIEEESLSIEEKEKELIVKALKKHKNKRKYAAEDLGISERTLYRKIKQYEI
jgi:transcriptional regulator with PAS, ATPase and Fis domain